MGARLLGLAAVMGALAAGGPAVAQTAGAPSVERIQLGRQIVDAVGGGANVAQSFASTFDAIDRQNSSSGNAEQAREQAFLRERLTFYVPQVLDAMALAYAREFDVEQLRSLLAFYRSPTGRLLQARQSRLTAEAVQAMGSVMLKLRRDMLAHQCAAETCTDAQKADLARLQAQGG